MVHTGPVQGMRDFLPIEVRRRQFLIDSIRRAYERYGFEPIDTPALERLEVLIGKGGDDNEKLIFKALKRGASLDRALEAKDELADAGLRFDLTVPLARYFVEHRADLPRVFRRYHIGPVWRADRPARGRFREFYQCDVDVIGSDSVAGETEVILATADALAEVGFTGFSVRLNDRRVLGAMLLGVGVAAEHQGLAVIALDKFDKIGWSGVSAELAERGIVAGAIERLEQLRLHELKALDATAALGQLRERLSGVLQEGALTDLGQIIDEVATVRPSVRLEVDPLLARGMGYYTGPIFEIASLDVPFSLGGGGRYDGLVERFGKQSVPAVGFSIGFERVLTLMTERDMFPTRLGGVDAYVTVFDAEQRPDALRLMSELRAAGMRVLGALGGSLKAQLKEANERGARYCLIAGPSEREQGKVQIKEMVSGESELVERIAVSAHIQECVAKTQPAL